MTAKLIAVFTALFLTVATVTSIIAKNSFKNYGFDDYYIGVETDWMSEIFNAYEPMLARSPYVVEVKALDEPRLIYKGWEQKVIVTQVHRGNMSVGKELYYTTSVPLIWEGDVDYEIDMLFKDYMTVGEKYLIFLNYSFMTEKDGLDIYPEIEMSLAPVFGLKDLDTKPLDADDIDIIESNAVKYTKLKGKELFTTSQGTMDAYLEFKKNIFKKYKIDTTDTGKI